MFLNKNVNFSISHIIIWQHIWKAYYECQFLRVLSHTSVNSFCRFDKNVNFGHLEKVSISYLLPAGGSIQAKVPTGVLPLSLASAVWKCRLINMKRGSPTGPHVFSLPLSPAGTSTLTSSLYLFPIHTQPHILSRAGCLFNTKLFMESAHCLCSMYSWWTNSFLLRLFRFVLLCPLP